MSKIEFLANFRNYDTCFPWYSSLTNCAATDGWVDVYGEYSLLKVIRNEIQTRSLLRLNKFVDAVIAAETITAIQCVKMLRKLKVYMLQGNLF